MKEKHEKPKAQGVRVTLAISGMTCDGCARTVKKALERVEGVLGAEVPSWREGRATVMAEKGTSVQKMIEVVKEAGYGAELIASSESDDPHRYEAGSKSRNPHTGQSSERHYDLVVIGTGGGGMGAALRAAEMGFRVAIVEAGVIGGTCVRIGCVPSKTLIRAARAYHLAAHHPFAGLATRAEGVDWPALVKQKDALVHTLRQQKYEEVLASYDSITLIRGRARLTADGTVVVDDRLELQPRKVVLATGARPRMLALPGIDQVEVLNSTTLMALPSQPESLLVIGGRAIALELGQAMARLGTRVTILQRSPRLVPEHDPEISEGIRQALEAEGIEVVTGVQPLAIRQDGGRKIVEAEVDGEARTFAAEQVLMAVGREPNTRDMGLEEAGVRLNAGGFIEVDAYLRTSNPDVFAVGDCTPLPKLVYVAAAAGGLAAENALLEAQKPLDLSVLPEVIFTDPQIATVGLTEEAARKAGKSVRTVRLELSHVPRALTEHDTRGFIKLVVGSDTDTLLGAHVLAPEGGEVIQTAALAVAFGQRGGFTVNDLRGMFFPYLTQVEGIKLAAQALVKDVSRLSCCAA